MRTVEIQRQRKKTTDICAAMACDGRLAIMTTRRRRPMTLVIVGMLLWTSVVSGDWSSVLRRKWSADDALSFDRDERAADRDDQLTTRRIMGRTAQIPPETQNRILDELRVRCLKKETKENTSEFSSPISGPWDEDANGEGGRSAGGRATCERTWDSITCWPETPAGQLAVLPCPNYINHFIIDGFASRQCLENGQWYFNAAFNRTWSNYSQCIIIPVSTSAMQTPPTLLTDHLYPIRIIYYIGYSLSFVVLLIAVTIMLSMRKLRCPRNSLHINLFVSFILRALIALSRDTIQSDSFETFSHRDDVTCRLLVAVFNFAIVANHSWIFVEGLYLHTLLFVTVFSETATILPYVVFGWTMPLICTVVWAMVRMTLENTNCWLIHQNSGYFWIIRGPCLALNLVNFCFFLNVIRVLFTKLRAFNPPDSRKYRHWKLTKSTLVLIPLFGVPYIVFSSQQGNIDPLTELIKLYFEQTYSSFNGIIVAMLYCFCNGEVQSELRKKWQCRSSREVNVRDKRRGTTVTSTIFASRSGQQSFRSAAGNSTVMLDQDDQLGTGYELTTGLPKCTGNGRVNHVRHPSSGSWNSESSAIQMKTLHGKTGETGEEGGIEERGVKGEDDQVEDGITTDDDGVGSSGFQQQKKGNNGPVQSLIIIIDN